MSSEAAAASVGGSCRGARQAALRLAVGVTACFALVELLDGDDTFLAHLLAANMLVRQRCPSSLVQGLSVVVLITLSTGDVLVLTTAAMGSPAVLIKSEERRVGKESGSKCSSRWSTTHQKKNKNTSKQYQQIII